MWKVDSHVYDSFISHLAVGTSCYPPETLLTAAACHLSRVSLTQGQAQAMWHFLNIQSMLCVICANSVVKGSCNIEQLNFRYTFSGLSVLQFKYCKRFVFGINGPSFQCYVIIDSKLYKLILLHIGVSCTSMSIWWGLFIVCLCCRAVDL